MSVKIVGYARTPFMRFNGALASIPATELGAHAAKAALERAGVAPSEVQRVIAGQVLQAGAGQNPARQTAVGAGVGLDVPAITLNAVCLSGAEAVVAGERLIASGEIDVVLAVGQESMSLAPHVQRARAGTKYGAIEMLDTLDYDGLTDAHEKRSMGISTEEHNTTLKLGRQPQDEVAAASHQRAAASGEFFAGEIAPFTVSSRKGDTVFAADDGIRPQTTVDSLSGLRPAFAKDGTVTAGNSSQITDGAAAIVLASDAAVERLGLKPLAEILSHAFVAGPDRTLHDQPSNAINTALDKAGAKAADLQVVEINEAFAAVSVQSTATLGLDAKIVNPHGGAIALGHPIGASGARIIGTLARQLQELGSGSLGAVGICGGGGQGTSVLLRSL
ncbi:acetyl-CoA C-acyltransferase [Arthrobacter sp. MYb224]|uniref:acetyl-CoA C-acyltransferase n=1 Tax=unclassified Arthrobacter TaxID=235627 RepID=UPI000CFC7EA7|nr:MULTISPECIES: acetyl-CoA C-acyltransferase [unclassified Arthrobacter]PRA00398.1 acetyl-CoA C-acyltransferase [Arthrobacter sp. MYb224]PRA04590.1 acetyl-CoA C-acyltransferase [Arthrobacter sp. MYb229]PRB51498.1 acetyl-CoA C-acyltransferase [Arthrobacter sp. MYb216]